MVDNLGEENYRIGELAKLADVHVETIRFYQQRQLLRIPPKPYGGTRRYLQTDLQRLKFIKSAQRLGFSLDEVAELLKLEDGQHCEEASLLARQKLMDVQSKIHELLRIEKVLQTLINNCQLQQAEEMPCGLVESLRMVDLRN